MKPMKERISITIDSDLLMKLRKMADNNERSLSQCINIILKNYVSDDNTIELLATSMKSENYEISAF
ncbi:MAG: ribbon-helix-helix protein, CopG family [Clostridia bacterium]|nr:ribbon-helix-helix protein, CopG family [Clostridia bacterium]